MFSSRRALAVIGAVVLALVIAFVVSGRRTPSAATREIATAEGATRLEWTRPNSPRVVVEKFGDAWRFREPFEAAADARAVGEVIAALRGARWHRSAPAGEHAKHVTATLRAGDTEIGIADALEGTEQTWIVTGGRALLVDGWVARALARRAFELQVSNPLATAAIAEKIVVWHDAATLELEHHPRERSNLRVDPEKVDALERALAALQIVGEPDATDVRPPIGTKPDPAVPFRIELFAPDVRVDLIGRATIATSAFGPGKVARAQLEAIEQATLALTALLAPDVEVVDRQLVRGPAERVVLRDQSVLDLHGRGHVGAREVDLARVTELFDVLHTPHEPVRIDYRTEPCNTVMIGVRALDVCADRVVSRMGEPVGFRLSPAEWSVLRRTGEDFLDRAPWQEDPLTITAIRVGDDLRFARGATIGAWTRNGAAVDAKRAAQLDQLAELLAHPAADDTAHLTGATHVEITVSPPTGAPYERALQLAAGCKSPLCAAISRATSSPS